MLRGMQVSIGTGTIIYKLRVGVDEEVDSDSNPLFTIQACRVRFTQRPMRPRSSRFTQIPPRHHFGFLQYQAITQP